jgi:hypothetical protein
VRAWRGKRWRALPYCLPLRNGDEMTVQVDLPAEYHGCLALRTATGAVRILGRWSAEDAGRTVRYPAGANEAVRLRGPAGTEVLLWCVRRDGQVDEAALVEACGPVQAWPLLPEGSLLAVERERVRVKVQSRDVGPIVRRADPEGEVLKRLDEVRKRLYPKCEALAGLAFLLAE